MIADQTATAKVSNALEETARAVYIRGHHTWMKTHSLYVRAVYKLLSKGASEHYIC